MQALLVSLTDMLPFVLTKVLNSKLEYCAIVVDDVEKARYMAKDIKPLQNIIQPFYELQECVENCYYDVILGIANPLILWKLREKCIECGVPRKKFFSLIVTYNSLSDFWMKNVLKFYSEHSAEFKIFATGISYTAVGLDANQFKYKLFNFGHSSQDLYYDYQIAKFALSQKGGVAAMLSTP